MNQEFEVQQVNSFTEIDDEINYFTQAILDAQEQAVPKLPTNKYALILTPDIISMIKIRALLQRRCQRSQVIHRKRLLNLQVNQITKDIKHAINELKNENWSHFLENLPPDNHHRKLWQTTKYLKRRCNKLPPLKVNDDVFITLTEKAEALANQFSSAHQNPLDNNEPAFTQEIEDKRSQFITINHNCLSEYIPTQTEIEQHLKEIRKSKATGIDKIHDQLIKNLPRSGIMHLSKIIMSCHRLCYFPKAWKHASVIAIHKPGKKATEPKAYRPISLLNRMSKLLEKTMLTRINNHLANHDIIPTDQCGFVKGKSTTHQLTRIKEHITNHLHQRPSDSTGMLLIDIEKAFDRVWHAACRINL